MVRKTGQWITVFCEPESGQSPAYTKETVNDSIIFQDKLTNLNIIPRRDT